MPIEAEGLYTLTDVWRGTRLVWRKVLAIYSALGLIIIAGAGVLMWDDESKWKDQLPWMAVGLFLIAFFWIFGFYRSYRTKKGTPVLQGIVRFQFDDDGIHLTTPHSQADVKWPALIKWKEGKHTFLTYQTPKIANVIPKRFFRSPADVDAMRSLMRTHIQPKKN